MALQHYDPGEIERDLGMPYLTVQEGEALYDAGVAAEPAAQPNAQRRTPAPYIRSARPGRDRTSASASAGIPARALPRRGR